jgi:hypothetical protein
MKAIKSFGILVEGYRGGVGIAVIARERTSRFGIPLGWDELSALES